jgi:hypothetical protein
VVPLDALRRLLGRSDWGSSDGTRTDAPFLFANRVDRTRENRVLNDVYARTRKGKKWHRVYEVGYRFADSDNPGLRRLGRWYTFACGDGISEIHTTEGYEVATTRVFVGVPDADLCQSCRASDRIWGKGEIKDKSHWDRWG